ncbi:hypothetical protein GCM10026915_36140 [Simiduia litorea]
MGDDGLATGLGDVVDNIKLSVEGNVVVEIKSTMTAPLTGKQKVIYGAIQQGQTTEAFGPIATANGIVYPGNKVVILIPNSEG